MTALRFWFSFFALIEKFSTSPSMIKEALPQSSLFCCFETTPCCTDKLGLIEMKCKLRLREMLHSSMKCGCAA